MISILQKRWVLIVLSLTVLIIVTLYVLSLEDEVEVLKVEGDISLQIVSVEQIHPIDQVAQVRVFAEVSPQWNAQIRSSVSGRIIKVYNAALEGSRVSKNEPLFEIEKNQYQATLASAEQILAQAKLDLWRAKNATQLARNQFERDGSSPPNDLALKIPELDIAEKTVVAAKAQLNVARMQLSDTTISAPFSGFVAQRQASLGQSVSVGETLVLLQDDSHFEMVVELDRRNWDLLDHPIEGQTTHLLDDQGNLVGSATIRQSGGYLDKNTRQYRVFLSVNPQGDTSVLAGEFLQASFDGRLLNGVLDLSADSMTREGYVWHVDQDDLLQRLTPKILFRKHDRIFIQAPDQGDTWQIVKTPLASFLPGQPVVANGN
ncbi:efflux RND transporter periplasmic adaptor subunit [Maritalea porphyrae]|uniref:efflux RND transporter periplasmic adaptor subunit n=1 Tax=Maritalea porphyrae TaxID=880732 RepID=UPI0022AF7A31|nr:efflux RND transporter periplasmic adaptor subunit [Maritalea porphyrae]MCZ4271673.1 efflux RND transporter periplasmic adaptor subunit [Maritalea porphyrae]